MNSYIACLKKYAVFTGRARRKEFWMFALWNFLFSIAVASLDSIVSAGGVLSCSFALAMIVPGVAVFFRRLHDIGKSAYWVFIALIPLVGGVILLCFMVRKGDVGENAYGPDPKD